MHQDNIDNKIRDIFDSMDDIDQEQALSRKEDVWQRVDLYGKDKQRNPWLWILWLSTLLIGAVCLCHYYNTKLQTIEKEHHLISIDTYRSAMAKMETRLNTKDQMIDSIMAANEMIIAEIAELRNSNITADRIITKVNNIYVKDTVYISKVKAEQKIVERVVRDTIHVEVPIMIDTQPVKPEVSVDASPNDISLKTDYDKNVPSSIQYNFSEAKLKDK